MALSKQMSRGSTLVAYCHWLQAEGYQVGEMHGFSVVHPVHAADSWHYDKENGYGLAVDVNSNGPGEMARLIRARKKAEEMGLAVTLAEKGYVSGHSDHLHVDVGLLSNLGAGVYHARGDGLTTGGSGGSSVAPAPSTPTVSTQEDDMPNIDEVRAVVAAEVAKLPRGDLLPIVAALYRQSLGAEPTVDELVGWDTTLRANPGWDGAHLRDAFLALPADRRAVIAAYAAHLNGRAPESEAAIAGWVKGRTIAQVWSGVAAQAAAGAK